MQQGNNSFGLFFRFYLNEAISEVSKLPATCTLNGSKVNILGYADNLVIVVPTVQALDFLINALTSKLYTLPLEVNVQKSSIIVSRHGNKKKCQQA